jgi:organic radical activating enzyme
MEQNLLIDEIFYGLQGEGNRMGFPSIFIRTGGCNLTCKGFNCFLESPKVPGVMIKGCDTIHAVNMEHFKHTWKSYVDFRDVVAEVLMLIPQKLAYNEERVDIVFTGGEPLLQHKKTVMVDVVKYFISRGHKVWFETNGTIGINFEEFPIYKEVSMSMSVKMSASGEEERKRWKPNVVDNYIRNTKDSYFKFVLSKKSITSETKEIFEFLSKVASYGAVYCMPLGSTQEEIRENAYAVYEYALANGLRYSDRLHIRIHNDLRGV